MKALHPLAAAALAAFALCATIALAADLGQRDAAAQFAESGSPVLQVYSSGCASAPVLDEKTVAAFRTISGVRTAVAIAETPVTLSGLGYTLPATVYAVPKYELKSLSLPLQQGTLPNSAWRMQALPGNALAAKLAIAAGRVGLPMPGAIRLRVDGGSDLDVQISGVAQTTGTVRDNGLWLDAAIARQLKTEEREAHPLPITRAEVETHSVPATTAVAKALQAQGYLVENPYEMQALTLADSKAMARQWTVLAAFALVCAVWALWRRPAQRLLSAVLGALCFAALGVALAAVLLQTAMLLGTQFFLSTCARYMLDAPRVLAVGLLAVSLAAASTKLAFWRMNKTNA